MVTEIWINLQLIQKWSLGNEEKERLIKDIINTIEKKEIIEGKEGIEIDYLKMMN